MADDLRIGTAASSGLNALRDAMGLGGGGRASASGDLAAVAASGSSAGRGAIGGPPGNRDLPADFPLDQLDRRARRGTYLDLLV